MSDKQTYGVSTASIGGMVVSRETPRLVVSVNGEHCLETALRAIADGAEIIEVRLDLFPGFETPDGRARARAVVEELKARAPGAPRLLTIRGAAEGGGFQSDELARADAYLEFLPLADALDVELNADSVCAVVAPRAQAAGTPLILSFHDFKTCPDDTALEALVERGFKRGAALVKLALMPTSRADVVRLLAFTERNAERPLVMIAMGDLGRVSRLLFPCFGSRLTYGHAGGDAIAPGQLAVADVRRVLGLLG